MSTNPGFNISVANNNTHERYSFRRKGTAIAEKILLMPASVLKADTLQSIFMKLKLTPQRKIFF